MESKFKVEKFDGRANFSLWQRRVRALLAQQQGLHKMLLGKEKVMSSTHVESSESSEGGSGPPRRRL